MQLLNRHFVSFSGEIIETTVVDKASNADDWFRNILRSACSGQQIIVGLDCKFRAHPIRSMSNKTATLQLCIGTKCLVLQLPYMDRLPQSIKFSFANPNITFVGVEVHEKIAKLRNEYQLFFCKAVDIRALAKIWFPISFKGNPSLRALAYALVGLKLRKTEKPYKCDWESRVLDKQLIEHASVDAYAAYKIAHMLLWEM